MSPGDDEFREVLSELFRHEVFDVREGLTYRRRCELTYERLRVAGRHLPPGSALLRDLPKLFTALEWAAIADPPRVTAEHDAAAEKALRAEVAGYPLPAPETPGAP